MKELFNLNPEEAAEQLNTQGHDFAAAELIDFGEYIKNSTKEANVNGELDAESLEQVSGGT